MNIVSQLRRHASENGDSFNSFIEQAAKDYDMTIDEVLHVKRCCAPNDDFYAMLELYIHNRKDQ